jgi:hypothetical protein
VPEAHCQLMIHGTPHKTLDIDEQITALQVENILLHARDFGLWYPKDTNFSLYGFTDLDWAGDKIDRKSTSSSCQFLGHSLVCWFSKKQNCISISTVEAEYVAVASCCARVIWMTRTFGDYGLKYDKVSLLCDNESSIKIAYNPILHGKTKHTKIQNHFIRDHIARGDIGYLNQSIG